MQFPDTRHKNKTKDKNKEKWYENLSTMDCMYLSLPVLIICSMIFFIGMELRTHFWLETTGTITKSYKTVERRSSGRGTREFDVANVEYSFTINGKNYTSNRRTGGLWNCNFAEPYAGYTDAYLMNHKVGKEIKIYYKESDPSACCIERVFSTTAKWCIFLLFVIFYEILHQMWPRIFWRPPLSK